MKVKTCVLFQVFCSWKVFHYNLINITLRRPAADIEMPPPSPVLRAADASPPAVSASTSSNNHSLDLIQQQHEIIRQQEQLILQQRKQIEVQLAILQQQQQTTKQDNNEDWKNKAQTCSPKVNYATSSSRQLDERGGQLMSPPNHECSTSPSQLSQSSQDTQMSPNQQIKTTFSEQLISSEEAQDQLILNFDVKDEQNNEGFLQISQIKPQQSNNAKIQDNSNDNEKIEGSTENEGNIVLDSLEDVTKIYLDPLEGCSSSTVYKDVEKNVPRKRSHSAEGHADKKRRWSLV